MGKGKNIIMNLKFLLMKSMILIEMKIEKEKKFWINIY